MSRPLPLSFLCLGAMLLTVAACEPDPPTPTPVDPSSCLACLEDGGTWQPEVNECTDDCDIMDISCFVDSCPEACAADNCGDCFDPTSCESATCTWNQEDELAWCN